MERIRLAKVKLTYTDLTKTSKELTEYLRTVLKVKEVQHIITYKNKDETTSLISLKKNLDCAISFFALNQNPPVLTKLSDYDFLDFVDGFECYEYGQCDNLIYLKLKHLQEQMRIKDEEIKNLKLLISKDLKEQDDSLNTVSAESEKKMEKIENDEALQFVQNKNNEDLQFDQKNEQIANDTEIIKENSIEGKV
jgi:hypothetical protein